MIRWLCAACLAGGLAFPGLAEPPARVVSMDLCTDQLAMLLAERGQLISVSWLAQDPGASAMAVQAQGLPANHGLAEEIYLLRPDLVLAGSFTTPSTVQMLRRLGLRVEVFAPETDMAGIRANLAHMGQVLGREPEAQATIAHFDADLAALAAPTPHPRAALYAANGYTSGSASLAGQIVAATGFANVADDLGLSHGGQLPLETLLMADPDFLILGRRCPSHSRAKEPLDHPALQALTQRLPSVTMFDPDWICGTPYVLRAVAQLRQAAP